MPYRLTRTKEASVDNPDDAMTQHYGLHAADGNEYISIGLSAQTQLMWFTREAPSVDLVTGELPRVAAK